MRRRKNQRVEKCLKIFNIFLFFMIISFGAIFVIISIEKTKEFNKESGRSLLSADKEITMLSKEIKEVKDYDVIYLEEAVEEVETDPDLDYAIKLFEIDFNKKIKKHFKKPFNYNENNYCYLEIKLITNKYKLKDCNGDAIYKRSLSLAIDKLLPIKRYTYNKINLKNEDIKILLSME